MHGLCFELMDKLGEHCLYADSPLFVLKADDWINPPSPLLEDKTVHAQIQTPNFTPLFTFLFLLFFIFSHARLLRAFCTFHWSAHCSPCVKALELVLFFQSLRQIFDFADQFNICMISVEWFCFSSFSMSPVFFCWSCRSVGCSLSLLYLSLI